MSVRLYPPTGPHDPLVTIRILRQTTALRRTVRPGEVIAVPAADARQLVGSGKAQYHRPADEARATAPPQEPPQRKGRRVRQKDQA